MLLFHLNKLNLLLANQVLLTLCILIKPNLWCLWSLKILFIKRWFPFYFAIILQGRHFVVDGPKNFKLLVDISFESGLQNILLLSLLLFWCVCYLVDLDDIQWNEVATSTARNLNNSRPLYLNFSGIINLCQICDSLKIQNVSNFYFEKRTARKYKFFMF